jgi:hypothetical protein
VWVAYSLFREIIYKTKMNFSRSRGPYDLLFLYETRMVSFTSVAIGNCPVASRECLGSLMPIRNLRQKETVDLFPKKESVATLDIADPMS